LYSNDWLASAGHFNDSDV